MLHAILFNKAGHSFTSNEVHWRQLFTASEDSLTSTIFGNLFHLPVELFWNILNESCYNEILANDCPKILSVEFWPHWNAENSGNINFIEPDIFIRTSAFDLIIEVKRNSQQSLSQWTNEFQGYLNEYGEENKKTILLAIDGFDNEKSETIIICDKTIKVIKCRWVKILNEIKKALEKLEKSSGYPTNNDSILFILNDIIMGFGIHGYATGKWFEDEDFSKFTPLNSYCSSFYF